jgi:VIT1/CCC1 family predicted Fe2+/Mn2+ transporter
MDEETKKRIEEEERIRVETRIKIEDEIKGKKYETFKLALIVSLPTSLMTVASDPTAGYFGLSGILSMFLGAFILIFPITWGIISILFKLLSKD